MSFGYDPEVPAGFQEGDFEQAELEAESARVSALNRRGICTHSWQLGGGINFYDGEAIAQDRLKGKFPERPTDPSITTQMDIPAGKCLCLDCGQLVVDPLAGRR